jgi:circadian clock protein KaiC
MLVAPEPAYPRGDPTSFSHVTQPPMTTEKTTDADTTSTMSSGLPGLDDLLGGGFTTGRAYQVRGQPGTGKTILGWHFLTAASERETALMITFDEPETQHRTAASRLGMETSSVSMLDLSPTSKEFAKQESYSVFVGPDVDQRPVPDAIANAVEDVAPDRIVVDSMLLFQYLSADAAQRRKQTLAFLRYLKDEGATVLLLSERVSDRSEADLHFLSDGIVELRRDPEGRTLSVLKQRGRGFRGGTHSISIGNEGMTVHPRLQPTGGSISSGERHSWEVLSAGVPEIDQLLGGGIDRGTATMISGPSGAGKTTLGVQLVKETAGLGERSVIFSFEEERETMIRRSTKINIPVRKMIEQGTVAIEQFRPWSFDLGQFDDRVRQEVEEKGTSMVMIDSMNSFWKCGDDQNMKDHIHRMCKYLVGEGVTVILINEMGDITGDFSVTEVGMSHLADTLIFLRYLEMRGELRKAIGVLKRRIGDFENSLREFQITKHGLKVGEPLTQLRGVLTGTPEWSGIQDGQDVQAIGTGNGRHM